jgi:hypothetical protein
MEKRGTKGDAKAGAIFILPASRNAIHAFMSIELKNSSGLLLNYPNLSADLLTGLNYPSNGPWNLP